MAIRSLRLLLLLAVVVPFTAVNSVAAGGLAYISPQPGARNLPPETTIILRSTKLDGGPPAISLRGSSSGAHGGAWVRSDDRSTLIFRPFVPFTPGETVTVFSAALNLDYRFSISPRRTSVRPTAERLRCLRSPEGVSPPTGGLEGPRYVGGSGLPPDFPFIEVTQSDNPEEGYIFVSNFAFEDTVETTGHLMILDDAGTPVFFRKMSNATIDFKKQPNGLLTYYVLGKDKFHAMDSTYTVVDSFAAGNGYIADFHDLQLLPNGHFLVIIYDPQQVDMSQVIPGGDPNAIVEGLVIQELDSNRTVVFQWRSWDHFQITDATIDLTPARVDYVHCNSIELDVDGNILISSRHMDEITKIDRTTGDVMWRFGGKNNEFTLVGDSFWFKSQHDLRRRPDGHLTMFDNGNTLRRSRSIEYMMDETNKIATKVWEYRNSPDVWGYAMGSSQRLPGGNTLIGWGSANPTVTEVRPDGSKAFELTFAPGVFSYRAFRFPWSGRAAAPYLWADTTGQVVTLGFEKFADPDVQKYYVYQGFAPGPVTRVDSTSGNSIVIGGLDAGTTYYFRVTAVNSALEESPPSNDVKVTLQAQTSVLVSSFEGTLADGEVHLTWELVNADEVTGFYLYRVREGSPVLEQPNGGMLSASARAFTDPTVASGVVYRYILSVVETGGQVFAPVVLISVPELPVTLWQNHPNPFNPATTVPYRIPRAAHVRLAVYDVAGKLVRLLVNGDTEAGKHYVDWDGRNTAGVAVASGVYFYRLETGKTVISRSMVLLR